MLYIVFLSLEISCWIRVVFLLAWQLRIVRQFQVARRLERHGAGRCQRI
jgi:hypothetical protein